MGYLHINNLYKDQDILLFKECYALEKIHGTSAHISFTSVSIDYDSDGISSTTRDELTFFSGGVSQTRFRALFDEDKLKEALKGTPKVTIYGEAYGGSCQKMSHTYGKELRFVAFDVNINDMWLNVPAAAHFVITELGLEFVSYTQIDTTVESINCQRDQKSVQAYRNGMGDHVSEGVVLRPLIELTKNNGNRIIVKHKSDEFRETKAPRVIDDPVKLKVLADAQAIAEEWVTPMRVTHVLDKLGDVGMEDMRAIMSAMNEDIKREAEGEIKWDKAAEKAVGRLTAQLVKSHFQTALVDK